MEKEKDEWAYVFNIAGAVEKKKKKKKRVWNRQLIAKKTGVPFRGYNSQLRGMLAEVDLSQMIACWT